MIECKSAIAKYYRDLCNATFVPILALVAIFSMESNHLDNKLGGGPSEKYLCSII